MGIWPPAQQVLKTPARVLQMMAACFVALVALGGGLGTSWAGDKSAAVVRATGEGGGDLQDQLVDVVEKNFGYKVVSDRALQKLAVELQVAVVFRIKGSKLDGGGHKVVVGLVFPDKKKPRSFTIYVGARASDGSVTGKLRDTLDVLLAGNKSKKKSNDDADADDSDDEKPKKKKKASSRDDSDDDSADQDDDDQPKKKKKKKQRRDDDDEDLSEAELRDMLRSANRAAIRLDFGPSVITRQLKFNSNPIMNPPLGYRNSPVPGAHIALEFFPLALLNPVGGAAGFGFGLDYDRTLSLSVRVNNPAGAAVPLPTAQSRLLADVRYRFVFGNRPTSGSLTVMAGYGRRDFVVDRSSLPASLILDMPDVSYRMFCPGLQLRFPVAPVAALSLTAHGMLVFDAGAIQSPQQYGQATITGADVTLALDILLGRRFALKLSGDFALLGYSFTGNGEQTNNRDGDSSTKDVGGASDRYIGGAATLAVMY
jgi:hypothetical protein